MNDILAELKGYFEAALSDRITTFYQGEVVLAARSYLPALMVFGTSLDHSARSTAEDWNEYSITIRIVQDLADKFTEEGTGDIIKAQQDLWDVLQERGAGGTPAEDTVLGVLTRNVRGTEYIFNNERTITVQTIPQDKFFYIQGEVQLKVKDLTLRS